MNRMSLHFRGRHLQWMWYGIHENTAGAGLLMIAPFSCFSKKGGYLFFSPLVSISTINDFNDFAIHLNNPSYRWCRRRSSHKRGMVYTQRKEDTHERPTPTEEFLVSTHQWPFQEPKLEVPTISKAYFSGLCKGISLEDMPLYSTVPPF